MIKSTWTSLHKCCVISEVVGRREGAGKAELELKTVRRQLESLRENRFSPDPAVETVQNIILGNSYNRGR